MWRLTSQSVRCSLPPSGCLEGVHARRATLHLNPHYQTIDQRESWRGMSRVSSRKSFPSMQDRLKFFLRARGAVSRRFRRGSARAQLHIQLLPFFQREK